MEGFESQIQCPSALISTAQQWETALTRHYLRSDGPFGATPLSFIDATPEQLALAAGRTKAEADEVLCSFRALFHNRRDVLQALSKGTPVSIADCEGPGWFRYLLFTCVVAAASSDLAPVNDYRQRIQAFLRWSSQPVVLSGIATLWRELAAWCEQKRSEGEPYRAIALPDQGGWRQIGYSLRVAFPSRADRGRLASLLTGREDIASPRALIAVVRRRLDAEAWSDAFKSVFLDFENRYRNGERLLADHAFWRLMSERPSLQAPEGDARPPTRVRMLTSIDNDVVLEIEVDSNALSVITSWNLLENGRATLAGPIDEVFDQITALPDKKRVGLDRLAAGIAIGALPFVEGAWGTWDWQPHPELRSVRVLATDTIRASASPQRFEEVFGAADRAELHERLRSLQILGGVRTAGNLLGLPRLLPSIAASPGAGIELQPIRVERGVLTARVNDRGIVELTSPDAVAGVWKLAISEHAVSSPFEIILRFVDRAIEHGALREPDTNDWPQENDVELGPLFEAHTVRALSHQSTQAAYSLLHLLEAIYAGGRSSWAEADLIPLIQAIAGTAGPSPWDILRALHEGGFLTPHIAAHWRARRWYLTPPKLYRSGEVIILDGAACQTLRERFLKVVGAKGGRASVRHGVGPWSVPLLVASEVDIAELAADLDVSLGSPPLHSFASSPACWRASVYDTQFRDAASMWDWDGGHFVSKDADAPGIKLQRWSRTKRDAPDIYTLARAGTIIASLSNRTAAIVEAYRRSNRPLFEYSGNLIRRTSAAGWLPDQAARRLRLTHLSSPGPIADRPNRYGYGYPCDAESSHWLSMQFGNAIKGAGHNQSMLDAALGRRVARYGRLLQAQSGRGAPR